MHTLAKIRPLYYHINTIFLVVNLFFSLLYLLDIMILLKPPVVPTGQHWIMLSIAADDIRLVTPIHAFPAVLLELSPSLHGDFARIEFALILDTRLLGLLASRLPRVTPREVVKLPECVSGEDEIPDRQGEKVDQHPHDVGPAVGCANDQDSGETKNETEEHQGDDLWWRVDDGDDHYITVSLESKYSG